MKFLAITLFFLNIFACKERSVSALNDKKPQKPETIAALEGLRLKFESKTEIPLVWERGGDPEKVKHLYSYTAGLAKGKTYAGTDNWAVLGEKRESLVDLPDAVCIFEALVKGKLPTKDDPAKHTVAEGFELTVSGAVKRTVTYAEMVDNPNDVRKYDRTDSRLELSFTDKNYRMICYGEKASWDRIDRKDPPKSKEELGQIISPSIKVEDKI